MSYCAIFERNLGEAIPSSSVSLCKTLLAYSVAEVNGYRYGRCFQRLIRRMFLYFFFPPFFSFFSLASSSPFPVCSRGKRRGVCVRVSREFPAKGRGSMGLCEFFPGLSFLSPGFVPIFSPFFWFCN